MFKKLKNKKGFTLVELIVVLVILAILAALLVPALTGYIDKANQEKVIAECRSVVVAAQTTASEYYGLTKEFDATSDAGKGYIKNALAQVKTLSEATDKWTYAITVSYDGTSVPKGTVTEVKFWDGNAYVVYTKSTGEAGTYSEVSSTNGTGLTEGVANSTINGTTGATS